MFDIIVYARIVWLSWRLSVYERAYNNLIHSQRATSEDMLLVSWAIINLKESIQRCYRSMQLSKYRPPVGLKSPRASIDL